jgi:protein-S-isoprenylcysteine O-methyltransferase Ste14
MIRLSFWPWFIHLLPSLVILIGPTFAFPALFHSWNYWMVVVLTLALVGTEPSRKRKQEVSIEDRKEDQGTVQLLMWMGYVSILGPIVSFFLWIGKNPAPSLSWIFIFGSFVGILGIGLRILSIQILGKFFTSHVVIKKDHELCEKGPYRWIRHPGYSGAILFFISVPLILSQWVWILVLIPFWGFGYYRRISVEEKALTETFGSLYENYKTRTWALFPFLF